MLLLIALFLGIIQGLTEFLPVSSSGHLVAVQNLLFKHLDFFDQYHLSFDVALHFATLIVIVIYFRKSIFKLLSSLKYLFKKPKPGDSGDSLHLIKLIIIGSIPTAILGILIKIIIEDIASNNLLVGLLLIVTGIILYLPRLIKSKSSRSRPTVTDAILIGTIQGFAVLPGISRSGSTITGGILRGLNRDTAFEFSFLLSIPAILGATLISLLDINFGKLTPEYFRVFLIGMLAGGGSGYLAIALLKKIVNKERLGSFSYYCAGLGILLIILNFLYQ